MPDSRAEQWSTLHFFKGSCKLNPKDVAGAPVADRHVSHYLHLSLSVSLSLSLSLAAVPYAQPIYPLTSVLTN